MWERGPLSVRDVMHALNETKPTGYTTVLKMMQIVTDKGLLDRDETQRPQIYRDRSTQTSTQRQLLAHLVQRAFGGSVKSMVLQALSARKLTPKEIAEIERLLDRVESDRTDTGAVKTTRSEGEKK